VLLRILGSFNVERMWHKNLD